MPELATERSPQTEIALRAKNDKIEKKALQKDGKERLGSGNDSLVFVDPRNPRKTIAISKPESELTPYEAKKLYYCHNIFATVFPHNFPHFYAAFGAESQEASTNHTGTVRERVTKERTLPFRGRFSVRNPFSEVSDVCNIWNIPLMVDSGEMNYVTGRDGGEYYLDVMHVPSAGRLEPLLSYMNEGEYLEKDKEKVAKYIKRLGELQNEQSASYLQEEVDWDKPVDDVW